MSRSFFFDTSALIKLYHQEIGTERVDEIFRQVENPIIISELATVELYSTMARKVRTREITPQAQEETLRNFEEDCTQRFVIDPLGGSVIQKAKELLQKYGNTKVLRSLDSLQLGACLIVRAREELVFVCADARLRKGWRMSPSFVAMDLGESYGTKVERTFRARHSGKNKATWTSTNRRSGGFH